MQLNLTIKHFFILLASVLILGVGYYIHSMRNDIDSLKNRTLPVFTTSDGNTIPGWDIVGSMYGYLASMSQKK